MSQNTTVNVVAAPTVAEPTLPGTRVTEDLVFAVVKHTGLSFGVVSMVLFGAQACHTALAATPQG